MKEIEIERLFRQHYDRMIRLARTMLYDDEESRDVVSEVFATLVKTDIMSDNERKESLPEPVGAQGGEGEV